MTRGNRIVIIPLLAAATCAGVFLAIRSIRRSPPRTPEFVTEQPLEMIDRPTLEITTLPRSEWEKLGMQNSAYKNPKTGEYTMVPPVVCVSCGAKIPVPVFPEVASGQPADFRKTLREYRCPKCQQKAYAIP